MPAKKSIRKPVLSEDIDATPMGMLLVISGPAGVGKDTVWQATKDRLPGFSKALTCTTRACRPGEQDGVNYRFVSEEEFDSLIAEDELLEWAWVHGNRYGVPTSEVVKRLSNGQHVVCVIDVQGALRLHGLFPTALLVFLRPPHGKEAEVLEQRILQRGAVDEAELAERLKTAAWELAQTQLYHHEIINDNVENASEQLSEIVLREQEAWLRNHEPDAASKQ